MNELIALVDDEPDILELVSIHLKKSGFKTKEFLSASDFQQYITSKNPDLVVLDLMLPDGDGLEICKSLKKDERFSNTPIIMLTARGDETDKIIGLELGADDYVTKPFSAKELVARVKAVLRRSAKIEEEKSKRIKLGKTLTIDLEKYEVQSSGKRVDLTSTEFKILKMLSERKGRVFTREQILDYLWGNEKAVIDRTVDVHIRHLRDKLGKEGSRIKNVRGVGYKLE